MANYAYPINLSILAGQSLSAAASIDSLTPVALLVPSVWTAANLTIQVSVDGVNYFNVYDVDGNEYVIVAAAGHVIALPPNDLFAVASYFKIRSGTGSVPVAQAADRVVTMIGRALGNKA